MRNQYRMSRQSRMESLDTEIEQLLEYVTPHEMSAREIAEDADTTLARVRSSLRRLVDGGVICERLTYSRLGAVYRFPTAEQRAQENA